MVMDWYESYERDVQWSAVMATVSTCGRSFVKFLSTIALMLAYRRGQILFRNVLELLTRA